MLNGQWIKRSTIPGEAYLMYEGKDMDKGIAYARQFGFKLIHIGDLFQSWGHFGLKTARYPEGAPAIRQVTNAAWKPRTRLSPIASAIVRPFLRLTWQVFWVSRG